MNLLRDLFNKTSPSRFRTKYHPGVVLGLAAGFCWKCWKLEAEYSYFYNTIEDVERLSPSNQNVNHLTEGRTTAQTILINGYYEYGWSCPWIPYIGVGAGYMNLFMKRRIGSSFLDDIIVQNYAHAFAMQGTLGMRYQVSCSFLTDIGYRFTGAFDPSIEDTRGNNIDASFFSNSLFLKLTYIF